MPGRTVRITTGRFESAPFSFIFRLSPIWDKMAREFADYATDALSTEMQEIASEMGKEMLRNIRRFALPHSLTGRLAYTTVPAGPGSTWRYYVTPRGPGGRGPGTYGPQWYLSVHLHDPQDVSPDIGRPVSMYVHAIERGGKPSYPLGKLARERIKYWASTKGYTATQAHRIARAIYLRGTDAYPFFTPAARATVRRATEWLEEGGKSWRDKVDAHFGVSTIHTGQYVG
jgi:hypothetical protein